jgi:hypothetical protein
MAAPIKNISWHGCLLKIYLLKEKGFGFSPIMKIKVSIITA